MEANSSGAFFDQEFKFELDLREDVGAELDDFLLLNLLGINDEAQDSIRTILWRHLRYFPVFAEVADYLIEKNDASLKTRLRETIVSEGVDFAQPYKKAFLNTVVQILTDESSFSEQQRREQFSTRMFRFDRWDEPILCHMLEIEMTVAARNWIELNDEFHMQILALGQRFLERQMLTDAARCFSIASAPRSCTSRVDMTSMRLQEELDQVYVQLLSSVGDPGGNREGMDIDEERRVALMTRISYLGSFKDCLSDDVTPRLDFSLPNETRKLLINAFDTLPDPTPRGEYIDLCDEYQALLDAISLSISWQLNPEEKAIDFSTKAALGPHLDWSHPSLAYPVQYLTDLLGKFVAVNSFQACHEFCSSNPGIFQEDLVPLQTVATHYLRQGYRDAAARLVQRRLMLRSAIRAPEDAIEWIKTLSQIKEMQEELEEDCRLVLDVLDRTITSEYDQSAEDATRELDLRRLISRLSMENPEEDQSAEDVASKIDSRRTMSRIEAKKRAMPRNVEEELPSWYEEAQQTWYEVSDD